jgi:hypothetical protein
MRCCNFVEMLLEGLIAFGNYLGFFGGVDETFFIVSSFST